MATPTIPNGALYMAATTYTGNGSTQTITNGVAGQSFQPDFVWIKSRSQGYNHYDVDSVRGFSGSAARVIQPNLTAAEETDAANSGGAFKSFDSNGFTVAQPTSGWAGTNENGTTYVGWQWKAGGTAVSNTAGTITSSVSANTTSGFSIVTYPGSGSNGSTVGHGLGATPSMIIVKSRSTAGTDWPVYHVSLGATGIIPLDSTSAFITISTPWNNTAPTSSVFTVGTSGDTNLSGRTYVAYCWAEIAGFSKFGSYTGNGSADGPFVYTGFQPKFILFKNSAGAFDWQILDSARNTYDAVNSKLSPNTSGSEYTNAVIAVDFLSNGFKLRATDDSLTQNGSKIIYAAFAANPFKYSNAG